MYVSLSIPILEEHVTVALKRRHLGRDFDRERNRRVLNDFVDGLGTGTAHYPSSSS